MKNELNFLIGSPIISGALKDCFIKAIPVYKEAFEAKEFYSESIAYYEYLNDNSLNDGICYNVKQLQGVSVSDELGLYKLHFWFEPSHFYGGIQQQSNSVRLRLEAMKYLVRRWIITEIVENNILSKDLETIALDYIDNIYLSKLLLRVLKRKHKDNEQEGELIEPFLNFIDDVI